jgi:3-hydroxyisobutyrate dehydrogenase-like beta-hydroxyacid dehydrogenase
MNKTNIAFIGMGIMGRPMALHLLKAGFALTINSRTKSKAQDVISAGAVWANSPAEAAKNADVVITCVTDTPDVKAVLLGKQGVIESAHEGLICVDMSTISPTETQAMSKILAEKKVILMTRPSVADNLAQQKRNYQ